MLLRHQADKTLEVIFFEPDHFLISWMLPFPNIDWIPREITTTQLDIAKVEVVRVAITVGGNSPGVYERVISRRRQRYLKESGEKGTAGFYRVSQAN